MEGCQNKANEKEIKSVKFSFPAMQETNLDKFRTDVLGIKGVVDLDLDAKNGQLFIDYETDKTSLESLKANLAGAGYTIA